MVISQNLDAIDRKILSVLQRDSDISLDKLGEHVGLSRNACWRRVRAYESSGLLRKRVALLDPAKLDLRLCVFIQVRTDRHDPEWLDKFAKAARSLPQIQAVYRMSGDLDYLIKAQVRDMAGYDALYQRLVRAVPMSDVAASFVMEEIKETTELAL